MQENNKREPKLKVEVWSDLICPWCGLGDHRLDAALARFEHKGDVEVVHRSFQLDPNAPAGDSRSTRDYLLAKGMSPAQIDGTTRSIERMAAEEGLTPYVVGGNRVGNTGLAHELLAYAASKGLGDVAWRRLFAAYFGEVRSVFDLDALVELASDIGLVPEEAREALTSRRYAEAVKADIDEARDIGVTGVPFFVFDRRYGVSGAQSADTLLEVLETAWREAQRRPTLISTSSADAAACGPDGCAVPDDG